MNQSQELLKNIEKLHLTALSERRVRTNLSIREEDVLGYCRERITRPDVLITRCGKNWYVQAEDCQFTIHATSYTIITAHKALYD